MTVSTSGQPWTLVMPVGSLQQYTFTFSVPGTGALYNITGATWEYVARPTATDLTVPPLIDITTSSSAEGVITVNTSLSQVTLTVNPAATVNIAPGELFQTLWMNPSSSSQFAWLSGALVLVGNPQP